MKRTYVQVHVYMATYLRLSNGEKNVPMKTMYLPQNLIPFHKIEAVDALIPIQ